MLAIADELNAIGGEPTAITAKNLKELFRQTGEIGDKSGIIEDVAEVHELLTAKIANISVGLGHMHGLSRAKGYQAVNSAACLGKI